MWLLQWLHCCPWIRQDPWNLEQIDILGYSQVYSTEFVPPMIDLSDFENFHFENFLKKKRIGVMYSSNKVDFDYIDFILKSLTLRRPICLVRHLVMFFVFDGRVSDINPKLRKNTRHEILFSFFCLKIRLTV